MAVNSKPAIEIKRRLIQVNYYWFQNSVRVWLTWLLAKKKRNRENCQEKDLSCKCFFKCQTHLFFISWITWSPSHNWFHSRVVTIITDNRPLFLDRQEKTSIKPWNCLVFFPLSRRDREKSINIFVLGFELGFNYWIQDYLIWQLPWLKIYLPFLYYA